MDKLLFVINPISGGRDKTGVKQDIIKYCDKAGKNFTIVETTGDKDSLMISETIKVEKPDIVVACGGDGTINMIAHLLLGKDLHLGIIPLGSANGLATELLIPKNISKALDILNKGRVIPMDVLLINDQYLSLHLSDVGFNAKLIKQFEEGGTRGKMAYVAQFFKVLFKKAPKKYTFINGSRRFKRRAEMVVFANASRYGTGAVVNPDGCVYDKKFEVCIFKPHPWYAIFRLAFDFFTGKVKRSPYVKIFSTRRIIIQSRKPVTLQVDGEVVGEFDLIKAEMASHQLKVIVPENFK